MTPIEQLDSITQSLSSIQAAVTQLRKDITPLPAPPPLVTQLGLMLREKSYWSGIKPFCDWVRGTNNQSWNTLKSPYGNTTVAVNSLGWLTDFPPGGDYTFGIAFSDDPLYSVNKVGTFYVDVTDGSGATVSFYQLNPAATANPRAVSPTKAAIDVTLPVGGNQVLIVRVQNKTNAPINVGPQPGDPTRGRIRVYHADDEADLNAGNVFSRSYLDALANAKSLRMSIWMAAVSAGLPAVDSNEKDAPIEIDYYQTDAHRSPRCPPSLLVALAKATGAAIYVHFPARATEACYLAYAKAMQAAGYPEGLKIEVECGGLEPWNFAYPYVIGAHWLQANVAPTIKVVNAKGLPSTAVQDLVSCSVADQSCAAWAAFESVFGRERIVRKFCAQAVWWDNFGGAFEYVDPRSGQRFGSMIDEYCGSMYLGWKVGGPVASVDPKVLRETRAHLNDDNWWQAAITNLIPVISAATDANVLKLKTKAPQARYSSYEAGMEMFVPFNQFYSATIVQPDVLEFKTDISSAFLTGEQAYVSQVGAASPSTKWNKYQHALPWVRVLDATHVKLYPTAADADADTNAYALDGLAASTFTFDNYTRVLGMDRRIKALLDGPQGAVIYQQFFDAVKGKVACFMQHSETNYWLGSHAGLRNSQFSPHTPRSTWFKTLKT